MKIAVISFTTSGKDISKKIKEKLSFSESSNSLKSCDVIEITKQSFDDKVSNHMKDIFSSHDALIFIASTGIAVRLIAPFINSKTLDPAVIVIDDLGKYTISLLSGHIGGANELTLKISDVLKNKAIITTASDGREIDAIDVFAKRNNFYIEDMEVAKILTALMVEGKCINFISEIDVKIKYENVENIFVKNLKDFKNYYDSLKYRENINFDGVIIVSSNQDINLCLKEDDKPVCILRPKNLNIGIGCRRGKTKEEIMFGIKEVFKDNNLSLNSVKNIGTIDIKHDEVGIIEVSKQLNAEMVLFSKSDIEEVSDKFDKSKFVKTNVGVTSVSEPSAYLLGKEMLVYKKIFNGVTIAVSRSEING